MSQRKDFIPWREGTSSGDRPLHTDPSLDLQEFRLAVELNSCESSDR